MPQIYLMQRPDDLVIKYILFILGCVVKLKKKPIIKCIYLLNEFYRTIYLLELLFEYIQCSIYA